MNNRKKKTIFGLAAVLMLLTSFRGKGSPFRCHHFWHEDDFGAVFPVGR